MKRLLGTATAALALTLAACDGGNGGNGGNDTGGDGGAPADPAAVVDSWLGVDCPAATDVTEASGLELPDTLLPGIGDPTADYASCFWGPEAQFTGGEFDSPMVMVIAALGDGMSTGLEMPPQEQVEGAGATYTLRPEFGENAATASTAGGEGLPASCTLAYVVGEGAEQRALNVIVGDAAGTDPEGLCEAALTIATMRG